MDLVSISGQMDATTRGSTLRITDKVRACLNGLTVVSTLARGRRARCMVKVLTGMQVAARPKESGLRDNGH